VSQLPPKSAAPSPRRAAPDTLAVHAGEARPKAHDSLTTPIIATSTYTFESTEELCRYFDGKYEREEYGRYGNPTVRTAEQKIAALDGAEDAALFASGMAAFTTTLLALLKSGDHVIMTSDCYRRSRQFVGTVLKRYGVTSTLVPPGDYAALEAAITPATKLVIAESPTNPYLRLVDLPRLVEVKRRHPAVKLLIDSTFATPVNQRPFEHGVDLVLHSATKYLAGHNDVLAGCVSGKAGLISALHDFRGVLGGVLDPHAAYLLLRGMKTLALRVRQQNESALRLARFLESHRRIERVHYPFLESHPDYAIAREQMLGGGGVISFEVRGSLEDTSRFIDACRIATIAPSLGGVETLIEQPSLMSYYELSTEQRLAIGIKDNLVRLAVGIEDGEELQADLARALDVSASRGVSYVI
jgi:cystathionine gamma-synthase